MYNDPASHTNPNEAEHASGQPAPVPLFTGRNRAASMKASVTQPSEDALVPLPHELDWENESAAASYFVRAAGHGLRYENVQGKWFRWVGHYWELDETNRVFHKAKTTLAVFASYCRGSWADRLGNRATIQNVLGIASADPAVACTSGDFDKDDFLLAANNGVIDLRTGYLRRGRPEDMISKHVPIAFVPGAPAQRWKRFLHEVFEGDQELIDYVQQVVGYALTGSTKEQVFWVLMGDGENGKSKFLNVLLHVSGGCGSSIKPDVVFAKPRGGSRFDMESVPGLRIATCSEDASDPLLDAARLKALTGEDWISTDRKYREELSFVPRAKLFLGVNGEPRVDDDTHAFWRRMRILPFNHQFGDEDRDRDILEKLFAEEEGIFAWMVEGAVKWYASGGLKHPDSVMRQQTELREANDPLAAFISARCELDPGARSPRGPFLEAYNAWATDQKLPFTDRLGQKKFQRLMKRSFAPNNERTASTLQYAGIRLKVRELGTEL